MRNGYLADLMSGAGGGGGYNYQADAFAFVASYALAGMSINWARRSDDIPIAIAMETGRAGDDLLVEMANGRTLEIQAKYHARLNADFFKSFIRLVRGLGKDDALRGVIVVDSRSSGPICRDLLKDIERLGEGREDRLTSAAVRVLQKLQVAGVMFSADIFQRLSIAVLDLDRGSMGQEAGFTALRAVLADAAVGDVWERLGKRGLEETALRGRSDLSRLIDFLGPTFPVAHAAKTAAATLLKYRSWLRENMATFPIVGFRSVRIDSASAWDEMLERESGEAQATTLADEFSRYHQADRESSAKKRAVELHADDLLLMEEDAVVVGAAGAGKSTLVRRLILGALDEGLIPLHVPLKLFASRIRAGATVDEALFDVALQCSGIDARERRSLVPTLLVADGLDECGELRAQVATHLLAWRRGHPNARLIVTTRSFGYASADFPGFVRGELQPLWPRATYDLSQAIFTKHFGTSEKAAIVAGEFAVAVETNHTAVVAARTPLLLGCLAALYAQGRPLPSRRAGLFREIADLLRDQQLDRPSVAFVNEAVADRVMGIAGWLLVDEPTLSRTKLRDAIGEHLHRDGVAASLVVCAAIASDALVFWEDRRLLERLTSGAYEIMTFVHLNLAEYAAGRFAAQLPDSQMTDWIRRSYREPRWRQAILLAAGNGAVEGVARSLLDLEVPTNDENDAAMLAAEALMEAERIPSVLLPTIVGALHARLASESAHLVAASAERLIALAGVEPKVTTEACRSLLDHPMPLVRLAAEAVVLAGETSGIPALLPRRWLESWRPIRRFGKRLQMHNDDLPAAAYDLQKRTVGLALDALFRTSAKEEALEVASRFLEGIRTPDVLGEAEMVFYQYGHHERFRELTTWVHGLMGSFISFDTPEYKAEAAALLDAIAAVVGPPRGQATIYTKWRMISRLLSAIHFFELDTPFRPVDDRALLEFAIDRAIVALGLDRETVRSELGSAYVQIVNLTFRGIYQYVQRVRVKVNWERAATPRQQDRILAALLHPAPVVNAVAVHLLEHGGAGEEREKVLHETLRRGHYYPLFWLAQRATQMPGEESTVRFIAERLAGTSDPGCLGILEALNLDGVTLLGGRHAANLEPHLRRLALVSDKSVARAAAAALQRAQSGDSMPS